MQITRAWLAAALLASVTAITGCDSNVGKGAAIGAAGGAGIGALGPGSVLGNAAAGAAAGAAGGYIYDRTKDKETTERLPEGSQPTRRRGRPQGLPRAPTRHYTDT